MASAVGQGYGHDNRASAIERANFLGAMNVMRRDADRRWHGEEAEAFLNRWQSVTAWAMEDAGSAKVSPETLGIPRP